MRLALPLLILTACVEQDLGPLEAEDEEPAEVAPAIAVFSTTARSQLQYVLVAHPDDEFAGWALVERSPANYNVFISMTRGEKTSYCGSYAGYAPSLGELAPGNRADYTSATCASNRIGSWVKFFVEMAKLDPYIGPVPTTGYTLTGAPLPAGTPGAGCAVSSTSFKVRPGKNMALIDFNLGDGNLQRCEVEWAVSQVRRLRGTAYLPSLPEYGVVSASFYNAVYPRCTTYTHGDHRAVHEAVYHTDFKTPGPQYGRTCSTDPDAVRVDVVDEYQAMAMDGTRRVGALQTVYGWLQSNPWSGGTEAQAQFSREQAFWRRF